MSEPFKGNITLLTPASEGHMWISQAFVQGYHRPVVVISMLPAATPKQNEIASGFLTVCHIGVRIALEGVLENP